MAVLKCNRKWEVGIKPEGLRIAIQGCKVETAGKDGMESLMHVKAAKLKINKA